MAAFAGAWISLLAACSSSETDANGWRHYSYMIGDLRRAYEASKDEIGGPGRLVLFCGGAFFDTGRGAAGIETSRATIRYRLDEASPVEQTMNFSGGSLWFDPPAELNPIVSQLQRARLLSMEAAPVGGPAFVMNFEVTGAGEAFRRVNEECRRRP